VIAGHALHSVSAYADVTSRRRADHHVQAERLRSTNSIEHDHMAVRRRTRVIRVFLNEGSFLRLASALAMERNEKWLAKRYVEALENVLNPEVVALLAA
jgi:transposase-like protein